MKRLDFYKLYLMTIALFLELLVLTVCSLISSLVLPVLIAVLFLELAKATLSVLAIEEIERTGEIKPVFEKADLVILSLNILLTASAVLIAVVTHFVG